MQMYLELLTIHSKMVKAVTFMSYASYSIKKNFF